MNSLGMSEEELEHLRQRTEDEFFRVLNEGKDIRPFLYFPYDFITPKVKKHLDEFLILEAFKAIEKTDDVNDLVVYKDTMIKVSLNESDKKMELFNKMIEYFISKEAYENCVKVKALMDKINS